MKVQCILCNQIEQIDPDSFVGKKLRHHPLATFMCVSCNQRVVENTEKRRASGRLKLPSYYKEAHDW